MSQTAPTFASVPRRVNYHDGMLLAAGDFQQEQLYHRGRLAGALARLVGFGTVAGLKVEFGAAGSLRPEDNQPRPDDELIVQPGVALDRQGRLVEVPKKQCLRLQRWFDHVTGAADASFNPLTGPANRRDLVADVFLRFIECPNGLRPAFPEPAADATDAAVPARTSEGFELLLAARDCDSGTEPPAVPARRFPAAPTTRRQWLDRVYASYAADPLAGQEYPADFDDHTAVFLSRVLIRLTDAPATDLERHASDEITIDDLGRPVLAPVDLLANLLPAA